MLLSLVATIRTAHAVENNYGEFLNTSNDFAEKVTQDKTEMIVFIREDCTVCHREKEFLDTNEITKNNFDVEFLDIDEVKNREKWETIVTKHNLSKVTPITLVGGEIVVGFNEKIIADKILNNKNNYKQYGVDFYLGNKNNTKNDDTDYNCNLESAETCLPEQNTEKEEENKIEEGSLMTLPFFGKIDIKRTSLFVMSSILGFIDGFNPCAMWVLLTFLIILSQINDRKKMVYLAGLFILAEGVMYFLILNIWYQAWDFIQLDRIVTPLVGAVAIGGGIYFLYKYQKNKGKLTCDVTSLEHQQKTVTKIKDIVSKPITIITTLAVLGIAFSVNIIEFACSVGIAQSFTKILELNELGFILQQWYIFIYSFFYMMDDFLIFGLAIFGYQKFTTVGIKYSHLSSLVGGILMIILGILLILRPEWLG